MFHLQHFHRPEAQQTQGYVAIYIYKGSLSQNKEKPQLPII